MEKAYLVNLEHSNQCKLIFRTNLNSCKRSQTNVIVKKTETVDGLIAECKNVIKETLTDTNVNVFLLQSNKLINGHTLCKHLLQLKSNVRLQINGETFELTMNAPFVKRVSLPQGIFVGIAIKLNDVRIVNATKEYCHFAWFRSADKIVWTKVGHKLCYVPTSEDLNCFLKLTCVPINGELDDGPPYETVSSGVVQTLSIIPDYCEFEERLARMNANVSERDVRIVSYNVLSERYADVTKFPYTSPKFLQIDYRMQVVVKEILAYNGDIVCLQEVDSRIYNSHYKLKFGMAGYESVFHRKGNRISEGLLCLFRKSKFYCIKSHQIVLSTELRRNAVFAKIWKYVKRDGLLKQSLMEQATSLQVTVLRAHSTKNLLIVFNTHLYYRADADQLRLVQIMMITNYLAYVKSELKQYYKGSISVVLCGDFNSQPNSPVVNYLLRNAINLEGFLLEGEHNFRFQSACGFPAFTNYTDDFKGCLDYIFVDPDEMHVVQSMAFPHERTLAEEVALPNRMFPSDHIALVADLVLAANL